MVLNYLAATTTIFSHVELLTQIIINSSNIAFSIPGVQAARSRVDFQGNTMPLVELWCAPVSSSILESPILGNLDVDKDTDHPPMATK
jgi:hypothetical protein